MRKGYKVVLFIGIGFIAAAIICAIVAFALSGFQFHKMISAKPSIEAAEAVVKNITEPFHSVQIHTADDDVILKPSENGLARIEYVERANADYQFSVVNGELRLIREEQDWTRPENILQNIVEQIRDGISAKSYDIILYLPRGNYQNLELINVSGNNVLEESFSFENVEVSTVSGNSIVKNLQNTKTLSAASTSGDVTVENVNVKGNVNTQKVVNVQGAIKPLETLTAASVSGELIINGVNVSGKASFANTSGSIILKNADFQSISAKNTSGDVCLENVDAKELTIETVSGEVYGTIRQAQAFTCKTVSGTISVPDGGVNPWYIETVSGNIDLMQ